MSAVLKDTQNSPSPLMNVLSIVESYAGSGGQDWPFKLATNI